MTGGDTECIKIFNTLAAKPQEFNDANLDLYALKYFVEKAKQVQNGTVFTSGNYSKLGSDLQQAEKFKALRNDFCGTTVLTDQCNQFFKDLKNAQNEKDVQLFIGDLLTAAGGPIAANILLTTGRVSLAEAAIIAREGLINYCRANQIACINYTDVIMGTVAGATIPSVLPAFGSFVTKTLAKLEANGVAKLEALGVAKLEELGAQKLEKTIATCAAPPACFVAGTMVQTPNGLKAIETFKPGDLVYSKDQFTQAPGVRPVVATKQTLDQLRYEVVVQNAQGQTETYTTTSEHPFWVINGPANGQWIKASLLQAGLHLTNALGETLEVISQTVLEQTATVYNSRTCKIPLVQ